MNKAIRKKWTITKKNFTILEILLLKVGVSKINFHVGLLLNSTLNKKSTSKTTDYGHLQKKNKKTKRFNILQKYNCSLITWKIQNRMKNSISFIANMIPSRTRYTFPNPRFCFLCCSIKFLISYFVSYIASNNCPYTHYHDLQLNRIFISGIMWWN